MPDGYELRHTTSAGLLVAGAVTFGTAYLVALASAGSKKKGSGNLAIPLIGPWLALTTKHESPCDLEVPGSITDVAASDEEVEECVEDALDEAVRLAIITADGVTQVVGATFLIAGGVGRRELVHQDARRVRVRPEAVGSRGYGLGVTLAF